MQDHCMEMYEEYRKSNRIIKYLEVKSDQNEKERVNKSGKCKARNETFLYCAVVAH